MFDERFRELLLSLPEQAILFLYRHYYSRLVHASESKTHDLKASEDIVQETFLVIWKRREALSMQHDMDFESYMFGIVLKKSIKYFATISELKEKQFAYFDNLKNELHGVYHEQHIQADRSIIIWKLIATFPRSERECLVMKFLENKTVQEIAIQQGVTKKAIERSITSAYKRFRKTATFIHRKQ